MNNYVHELQEITKELELIRIQYGLSRTEFAEVLHKFVDRLKNGGTES